MLMFLLLDLLSWTSVESFLFPFLASFKTVFVQGACSVRKQQYGKTILYLLSSARKKKYLDLFAFFNICHNAKLF